VKLHANVGSHMTISHDIRGETGWKVGDFDKLKVLYVIRSPGTW